MSESKGDKETFVYKAKLAEQAERYEGKNPMNFMNHKNGIFWKVSAMPVNEETVLQLENCPLKYFISMISCYQPNDMCGLTFFSSKNSYKCAF